MFANIRHLFPFFTFKNTITISEFIIRKNKSGDIIFFFLLEKNSLEQSQKNKRYRVNNQPPPSTLHIHTHHKIKKKSWGPDSQLRSSSIYSKLAPKFLQVKKLFRGSSRLNSLCVHAFNTTSLDAEFRK